MRRTTVDAVLAHAKHSHSNHGRRRFISLWFTALSLGGLAVAFPARARAQTQLDVHGSWARGSTTDANSWGAGAGIQGTIAGKSSALALTASPSFD